MRYLNTYKIFEATNLINGIEKDILNDINDVVIGIEDKGFYIEIDNLKIRIGGESRPSICIFNKGNGSTIDIFNFTEIVSEVEYIVNHLKSNSRIKNVGVYYRDNYNVFEIQNIEKFKKDTLEVYIRFDFNI